jgi:xanthine/CO dehydrogenase XdhC/CoxF family maturation factor
MMPAAMARRARELTEHGEAFVSATVVRAQRPTSVEAGDAALVLADGSVEGFVGGSCAEHSVRAYALQAIASQEALLLRILPFGDEAETGPEGREAAREEGAVTVENPCLSGGAIEIFLEPVVPAPRVLVVGDTPIAAAVVALGAELDLDIVAVDGDELEAKPGDLALVVAAQGATSCTPCAPPSKRACPTSAWWPAASAATGCSASCAATACRRSCSIGSTSPPDSTSGRARPRRSRCRSSPR